MNLDRKIITVGVGDLKITKSPNILKTLLGSCIGIVLYDPVNKVGGLLHIMLPNRNNNDPKITKYANPGITYFIQQIIKNGGAQKNFLYAKIFGGAKMFETQGSLINIGEANENAVRKILNEEGMRLVASKTGGTKGYNLLFHTQTGKVTCRVFGEQEMEY